MFVINTPQMGFNIVSQALAEESSDDGDSGSGDDDEKESDDQSDDEQSDEEKCVETEETESDDQPNEETCDNTETDEQSDDQTEQTEQSDDEQSDDQLEQTEDKEATQNQEASDSLTQASMPTILDVILKDDSLLKEVVDDNTTESGLATALTEIQEEQNQPVAETCGNAADDDGDGMIDENCPPLTSTPAETCGNAADDDGDGTIDEEDCVVPPAETCGNATDDDGDGTIDEEDCVVPPTEICNNQLDDDVDGKIDEADEEDCPTILPAVVIESAQDEEGEPLSQGDMIAPGEVTFTFSTETSLSTRSSQADSQDYAFECALDDESFNSCNSPVTYNMEEGKHDFVVRLVPLT